ncbi:homocysteine S-methyltransferase family protein [Lactococcus nasutitermitis]|uniref:Methionine synthase n=1 Tax=Lactococcus nasutitermitis TaxID=1652957 RepID=A0ABV9JAL0_9LACT|nr:homocysteine S-methyltransferase family protein [Lactococcus nasutitermitis]
MGILEDLKSKILLIDGAMGTQLQARGLPVGENPEYFNLEHPEIVLAIHQDYVAAGADIITTNTFQANAAKLKEDEVLPIINAAVTLAQKSGAKYVAYDMGPTGHMLQPLGTMTFTEAYELFKIQAIAAENAGADLIILETMADLLETKIAILAIKENTDLPIFATMTFQEDGRTFVGTDPVTATLTLQNLGVDAVGANCSLGPKEILPTVEKIAQVAKIPVMVQANAGLPVMENGETVYKVTADEYSDYAEKLLTLGVTVLGSCCGSTPAFTAKLRQLIDQRQPVERQVKIGTFLTSALKTIEIKANELTLIGERINPTGKPRLKEALRQRDVAYIVKEAVAQRDAGADILDVNVGLPEIDEADMMKTAVSELQSLLDLPLQLDSSEISALEAGARIYNGVPLINSVNGKQQNLDAVLPIVAKYGAVILGLCLDEDGIPDTAEKRFAIAQKIINEAAKYGIDKTRVMIDPLVLTASAQQEQVQVTLDTLRMLREINIRTVVGLSNISFGLPNRALLNGTFLAQAFGAGLCAPIMNPKSDYMMSVVRSLKIFSNQDKQAIDFIEKEQNTQITTSNQSVAKITATDETLNLQEMIIKGRKELTEQETKRLLAEGKMPLEIVDGYFIPALNEVGDAFGAGTLFLPQLMQSAEATKNAQEVLKMRLLSEGKQSETNGKILLCTVEGDIHDIGKNIVKMILENYGYDIIDLGKDVPIQQVVDTVLREKIELVGLSALMTTTVQNMKKTITAVREVAPNTIFMVGGAVLNKEYKEFVGADYYAKDAMASVTIAQEVFRK